MSWYPNNMVLRMLTPASTCRPLEIYPVHLGEASISVDVSGEGGGRWELVPTFPWSAMPLRALRCAEIGLHGTRDWSRAESRPPETQLCHSGGRAARSSVPLPACSCCPALSRHAWPSAGSTVGGAPTTRGGSDTSLENNNVYGLEPKVYVEGSEAAPEAGEQTRRGATWQGCSPRALAATATVLPQLPARQWRDARRSSSSACPGQPKFPALAGERLANAPCPPNPALQRAAATAWPARPP